MHFVNRAVFSTASYENVSWKYFMAVVGKETCWR